MEARPVKRFSGVLRQISRVFQSPWVALIFLNVLLMLPSWLRRSAIAGGIFNFWYERQIFTLFWVSVDLLFLAGILFYTRKWRFRHWIRRGTVAIYTLLLIFEVYAAIIQKLYQRPPVIYNDLYLVTDGIYLLLELGPGSLAILVAVLGGIGYVFGWLIPGLFRAIQESFVSAIKPVNYHRGFIVALIIVVFVQFDWGIGKRDAATQLVSSRIAESIQTSKQYHSTVNSVNLDSLAASFQRYQNVHLNNPPDVYMILLESYGKIIHDDSTLYSALQPVLSTLQSDLDSAGWYTVTNYSEAPVTGGGSWLSHATVLSGARIANEPLYHHFIEHEYPTMVRFFNEAGYRTFLLHPADRARPGLPLRNPYEFHELITYKDLNYTGEPFGWGIIPDQYSLNYTKTHYLDPEEKPVLLYFTTLATHVTWTDESIPPLVTDWRSLNQTAGETRHTPQISPIEDFLFRAKRVFKQPHKAENFPKLMAYDLRVLKRFILREVSQNSLIVIIGDHQPPLLVDRDDGMQTILHIITKRRDLAGYFQEHGFGQGLVPDSSTLHPIEHADIYGYLAEGFTSVFGDTSETISSPAEHSDTHTAAGPTP